MTVNATSPFSYFVSRLQAAGKQALQVGSSYVQKQVVPAVVEAVQSLPPKDQELLASLAQGALVTGTQIKDAFVDGRMKASLTSTVTRGIQKIDRFAQEAQVAIQTASSTLGNIADGFLDTTEAYLTAQTEPKKQLQYIEKLSQGYLQDTLSEKSVVWSAVVLISYSDAKPARESAYKFICELLKNGSKEAKDAVAFLFRTAQTHPNPTLRLRIAELLTQTHFLS